jgi:hypothetical protein
MLPKHKLAFNVDEWAQMLQGYNYNKECTFLAIGIVKITWKGSKISSSPYFLSNLTEGPAAP